MTSTRNDSQQIPAPRAVLLFCIFFLIACGLGYPILNRYDPRLVPGLSDVRTYATLVTGTGPFDGEDLRFRRFRVLVPCIAKPFYLIARDRVGSWDPVMFGLLVSDSLFVAGTALLIVIIGNRMLRNFTVGIVGALLYLLNFAVPNLRLVGLVDAGEGFFLLALLWSLSEYHLWTLPIIGVLGALAKESFIPFSIALAGSWWLCERRNNNAATSYRHEPRTTPRQRSSATDASWIVSTWVLSIAAIVVLQWRITGQLSSPLQFGLGLTRGGGIHFGLALHDRNLLYTFLWLLPLAIPHLKDFPKSWLIPIAATCLLGFVLDAYFGGTHGTGSSWSRILFSIAGPMLCLSSARFLLGSTEPQPA